MPTVTRSLLEHLVERAILRADLRRHLLPPAVDFIKDYLRHLALHPDLPVDYICYQHLQMFLINSASNFWRAQDGLGARLEAGGRGWREVLGSGWAESPCCGYILGAGCGRLLGEVDWAELFLLLGV